MNMFKDMPKALALAGVFVLGASASFADPVYTDPVGSNPDLTFYNPGGAAGDCVTLIPDAFSVGVVQLCFWVFKTSDNTGYFYAYQLINVSAGSISGGLGSASLKFLELDNIAPHLELGMGGGKHGGAVYNPWSYLGDNSSTAVWAGTTATSINPGETSPAASDTLEMYELYSEMGPGDGILNVATTSGGGYTGQSISVLMPTVPEPSSVAAFLTGGLALAGLARRRRK